MKIKYKNFLIEEDTNCYILTEFWIAWDRAKEENMWKEMIVNQKYPHTLERCLEIIRYRLSKNKTCVIELDKYINELKNIDKDFINDFN